MRILPWLTFKPRSNSQIALMSELYTGAQTQKKSKPAQHRQTLYQGYYDLSTFTRGVDR